MRLEEICTVFTDGDWIESKDQSDDGIRLIQTGNIGEGIYLEKEARAKYISEEIFGKLKCTEIFPGDILVSRLPDPVGRACIIPEKEERMITAVDCTICRPNESIISKEYLCYFMRSSAYYKKLLGSVTGTTRKRISRKNLGNVELEVPSKERQMDVVEQLDCLVKVIESRKQELQLLDDLIKARFIELFGDPVSNPKDWNVEPLGNRCGIITGNTPPRSEPENYGKYIEWIKSDNINTPFTFITKARECLSEAGFEKCRFVEAGSILMTCIAGSIDCIGNVAVTDRRVAFNQQINAIVPEQDEVLYLYWLMQLSKPMIHRTINMALKGILSKSQLSEIVFPFPPITLQEQFAAFVEQTDKSKVAVQKALEETQLLFDSLMQQYFG